MTSSLIICDFVREQLGMGLPGSSVGKRTQQCRRPEFDSLGRSLERKWQPLQYSCPGKSLGQKPRRLNLWGHKSQTQLSDYLTTTIVRNGLPWQLSWQNLPAVWGTQVQSLDWKTPGGGNPWQPTLVPSHGQRSLSGLQSIESWSQT